MAGTIVCDTIQDGAGNSTATDNAIYGSAKAWVNFNGSTAAIRASYNVSSVTRNSTGDYTINFTNALTDANYAPVMAIASQNANPTGCVKSSTNGGTPSLQSTTQLEIVTQYITNGVYLDVTNIYVVILR